MILPNFPEELNGIKLSIFLLVSSIFVFRFTAYIFKKKGFGKK